MNFRIVIKVLCNIMVIIAVCMIPPAIVALIYKEDCWSAFAITSVIMFGFGLIGRQIKTKSSVIKIREGFLIVACSWLIASIFGAIPFILSGAIPSPVDAFFETVSGFTTTGASILKDVEIMPQGILFWRSFTHWLGGMGILVFAIAILPALGIGGVQIAKAETTGPILDKLTPKMTDMAKYLYLIYFGMTIVETILLLLGGLSLFDALVYTFGSVGTGGFSIHNVSVAVYDSVYVEMVVSFFMLAAGVNFALYFDLILKGRFKPILEDSEFKFYVCVVGIIIAIIALDLYFTGNYGSIAEAARYSIFQTASVITTTGYATTNYDLWPTFSKMALFALFFVGGCCGSTSGGIKCIRVLVSLKLIRKEMTRRLHPRAISSVKINGEHLPTENCVSIITFIACYLCVFLGGILLISIDEVDFISAITSVGATLGNIGPGFAMVGPASNFSVFSDFSKLVFSFLMLAGRLELYTLLLLFSPRFWNPHR